MADKSEAKTFEDVQNRLQEIAKDARKKDVSLKSALDMFDEAIALSNKAVDLVDTSEFSDAELSEMHTEELDEQEDQA